MEIAVAVSGIERLHRHRNQEITWSGMTNPFAFRRATDAIDFVHGMRHVIGKGRSFQSPLRIGLCKHRECDQQEAIRIIFLFMVLRNFQ